MSRGPAIRAWSTLGAVVNDLPIPAAAIETRQADGQICHECPSDERRTPILVIEDEPVDGGSPGTGVRRENYRQLFSRLRHGA